MWPDLSDLDLAELERHYGEYPFGDLRPMRRIIAFLRGQPYSRRLSAFTSHFTLVVTPALGHDDHLRREDVRIDFDPKSGLFSIDHLDPFGRRLDRCQATEADVTDQLDGFLQRLVSASEMKLKPPGGSAG